MPLLKGADAPAFTLPGLAVRGLASPSRGSRETAAWRITLPAGTPGALHSMSREELFVALSGHATATLGGAIHRIAPGDTLVVPAGEPFILANPGTDPFEALAIAPVGVLAAFPEGEPFMPPWLE